MIELNADIGEGCDDASLMPYLNRVSIACGGHIGDAASMRLLCAWRPSTAWRRVRTRAIPTAPSSAAENWRRRPMRSWRG